MKEAQPAHDVELTDIIIGCAIEAHKTLGGPGLLERIYQEALVWELGKKGLQVESGYKLPVVYKGTTLAYPLEIDIWVERRVIVECKATIQYNSIFEAQLLTYLRLSGCKTGLVLNFGEALLRNGIYRVGNKGA
jgi:GxxExxY protein